MAEQEISTLSEISYFKPIIRMAERSDLPALEWDGEFSHFRIIYANAFTRMLQGT